VFKTKSRVVMIADSQFQPISDNAVAVLRDVERKIKPREKVHSKSERRHCLY